MFGVQILARAEIWLEISTPPAPQPTHQWWVHWQHTVSGKKRRWGRRLATHPHMPRLRKWSRYHFIPMAALWLA